jgi:hypothetical protein
LSDARIQPRPHAAVEGGSVAQGPRRRRAASTADEAFAVARRVDGARPGRGDDGGERHRLGVLTRGAIAREDRFRGGIDLGGDETPAVLGEHSEHEAVVGKEREPARPSTTVDDAKGGDPHRVFARREQIGLKREACGGVIAGAEAEPVAHFVVTVAGRWSGQGRPERAGVFVAHVERLSVRIEYGIVAPGGQSMLAAVAAPCGAGAGLAQDEAEAFAPDDVGPWARGPPSHACEADHVLVPGRRESAEAVEEAEIEAVGLAGLRRVGGGCVP